ncbi:uncharacterized protein LOC134269349 [Saccostrea cucullata]|uniref:uncharacterized protein LOC134269349 n=1 Tax=Saccostrea cuccullata TaxID=36930 RepID=UPI002ED08C4B
MTRHRKRVQEKSSLPSTKRRRLMLKQERAVTQGANEALEGASYQSGIGLTVDADVEHLPEAVPQGNFKPVPAGENTTFIVFDLETTDLVRGGKYPHITQIAASVVGSVSEFSAYVYPKVPIASTAQQITGIIVNNSGTMTVHGQQVHAEDLYSSIDKFCKWLKKYPSVYLIAHNGRKFDFPVLMNAMMNIKREAEFLDCVTGCIDSLNVFKKAFTSQSYKQEDLARTILNTTYDAHNAMEDVKVLGKLISHTRFDATKMCIHSFPPSAVINQIKYNREKAKNVTSLHLLVGKGILKMSTAEKVAGSGLNLGHLKKIYEREGEDGLRNIFSCKNREGQPRVTNIKKTLEEIMPKLGQFFSSCDS